MSRVPSSPMMRGWGAFEQVQSKPVDSPKVKPGRGRNVRVTVEPRRKRNAYRIRWKDLTPEELTSFQIHPEVEQ